MKGRCQEREGEGTVLSSEGKHTAQTAGMLGREGHHSECETKHFVLFPCGLVRSQRATGIGRLMVNVVEGIELKPCRSHGKGTNSTQPL